MEPSTKTTNANKAANEPERYHPNHHVHQYILTQLRACPKTGGGVHIWLFRTAKALHEFFPKKETLVRELENAVAHCGRDVLRSEVENAVANSAPGVWKPTGDGGPARWPCRNIEQVEAIVKEGPTLEGLREMSPGRFGDSEPHTEEVIDQLFPGNPLICAGMSERLFSTRPREEFRGGLWKRQFIVSSPMTAKWGKTKTLGRDGKVRWSQHSLDNTGPRRFQVVEFDPPKWDGLSDVERARFTSIERYQSAMRDEHAALLCHLAGLAPLALAVHSGGKSIHGWFYCDGQDEQIVLKFMKYAVSLGADRATWNKTQFVRMPDGRRANGNRQSVVFFNPQVLR